MPDTVRRVPAPTVDNVDALEWIDPRKVKSMGADVLALTIQPASRSKGRSGRLSPGACRWFRTKHVDRVRFVISSDGRFCALDPDSTGVAIRGREDSSSLTCVMAMPEDAPETGTVIELSPIQAHGRIPPRLIGQYRTEA